MTADTIRLDFRRPSGSVAASGIEVAADQASGSMVVRHSGDPHGPTLVFDASQWRRLTANLRRGSWIVAYFTWDSPDRAMVSMTVAGDDTVLRFSASDMAAFERAVHNGEFDL